jgi:hypothetical protein
MNSVAAISLAQTARPCLRRGIDCLDQGASVPPDQRVDILPKRESSTVHRWTRRRLQISLERIHG